MRSKIERVGDEMTEESATPSEATSGARIEGAERITAVKQKKKVEQVSVSISTEDRKAILEISVNVFPILGKVPSQTKVYASALKAFASLSAEEQAKWFMK